MRHRPFLGRSGPARIEADRIQLGMVGTPSGVLAMMDCGLVRLWSHDRNPRLPDGILASNEATALVNGAVDLRLTGRDAEACGLAYGRSAHPLFIYDVPPTHLPEALSRLRAFANDHGFDVSFEIRRPRIPHLQRARDVLARQRSGGAVSFHGIWAGLASGLPEDRELPVFAEVHEGSEYMGLWQRVYVEAHAAPVASSEPVGWVKVEQDSLLFCDLEKLGAWADDRTLDRRADLVFWGRDAARVASEFLVPARGENTFGWVGHSLAVLTQEGQRIQQYVRDHGHQVELEFRPHTHHWLALEQVQGSRYGSAILELDGVPATAFATTWGDGLWEVHRDLDAQGRVARVRIELADPATIERLRGLR